jgi:hypothetical protein
MCSFFCNMARYIRAHDIFWYVFQRVTSVTERVRLVDDVSILLCEARAKEQ